MIDLSAILCTCTHVVLYSPQMFEAAAPSPDPLPTGSDEREDEGKKDTKHAPALLEGPNVDDEGALCSYCIH